MLTFSILFVLERLHNLNSTKNRKSIGNTMNKLIITLIVLILSPVLACNSSYDAVAGIKIGCSLNDQNDINVIKRNGNFYVENIGIFDVGQLITNGDQVDSVLFVKEYNITYRGKLTIGNEMKKDISGLLDEMTQRWGSFTNDNAKVNIEKSVDRITDGFFDVSISESIEVTQPKQIGEIKITLESFLPSESRADHPAILKVYYLSKLTAKTIKENEKERYKGF